MPLFIFAGAEIVLALIATRIAWWIFRSGGLPRETSVPARPAPDPPATPHPAPRRAAPITPKRPRTLSRRRAPAGAATRATG